MKCRVNGRSFGGCLDLSTQDQMINSGKYSADWVQKFPS